MFKWIKLQVDPLDVLSQAYPDIEDEFNVDDDIDGGDERQVIFSLRESTHKTKSESIIKSYLKYSVCVAGKQRTCRWKRM